MCVCALANLEIFTLYESRQRQGLNPLVDPSALSQYRALCYHHITGSTRPCCCQDYLMRLLALPRLTSTSSHRPFLPRLESPQPGRFFPSFLSVPSPFPFSFFLHVLIFLSPSLFLSFLFSSSQMSNLSWFRVLFGDFTCDRFLEHVTASQTFNRLIFACLFLFLNSMNHD